MIVVADASPLNILVRIGYLDILPTLFGRVVIPVEVAEELMHERAPEPVRRLMLERPGWLDVRAVTCMVPIPGIDPGELAAINLALACRAEILLIDDRDGRKAAVGCGLTVMGTIGVLDKAARRGLIDAGDAVNRLRATDFRVADDLLEGLLRRPGGGGPGPEK